MPRRTPVRAAESPVSLAGTPPDAAASAASAGLIYVSDSALGLGRRRHGKSFRYFDAKRRPVLQPATLGRIRALAIPPAWTEVWICADARGHLQASGRDARGRKQYRYHAGFRAVRELSKFDKVVEFANALPKIRARCEADLALPGLTRDKVLALVVTLLSVTFIRVGNEEYARLNKSFGLTTLRDKHARCSASSVAFHFRAKSGKDCAIRVFDRRLSRIVKRCQDLPGELLFQYRDASGVVHGVDSADVNEYLRSIAGASFTAKDFRTWAGTTIAALTLAKVGRAANQTEAKRRIRDAVIETAQRLGNTPTICRKCYIHPAIPDAYLRGHTIAPLRMVRAGRAAPMNEVEAAEKATIAFLRAMAELAKKETRARTKRVRSA